MQVEEAKLSDRAEAVLWVLNGTIPGAAVDKRDGRDLLITRGGFGVDTAKLAVDIATFLDTLDERKTLIATQEQLDTLPFLAVIREVFRNSPSGKNYGGLYERRTSGWEPIAGVYKDGPDNGAPRLPCRLLYPTT